MSNKRQRNEGEFVGDDSPRRKIVRTTSSSRNPPPPPPPPPRDTKSNVEQSKRWEDHLIKDEHGKTKTIEQLIEELKSAHQKISAQRKRESTLLMRLSEKQEEIQKLQTEIAVSNAQKKAMKNLVAMIDPLILTTIDRLRSKIKSLTSELEETKLNLQGYQFTPNSISGLRLIAKLRSLQSENEQLGRQLDEGKAHKALFELAQERMRNNTLTNQLNEALDYNEKLKQEIQLWEERYYNIKRQNLRGGVGSNDGNWQRRGDVWTREWSSRGMYSSSGSGGGTNTGRM